LATASSSNKARAAGVLPLGVTPLARERAERPRRIRVVITTATPRAGMVRPLTMETPMARRRETMQRTATTTNKPDKHR